MVFYWYFLNEPHVHEQAFSTSVLGPADQQSFFCVQEECALWSVFKGFSGFLVASDTTIIRYHERFLFDNPNTTCWYLLVAAGSVFPHWKSHCFFEHLAHRISNQEEIQDCITHSLHSFISPSQSHRSFFILKWLRSNKIRYRVPKGVPMRVCQWNANFNISPPDLPDRVKP